MKRIVICSDGTWNSPDDEQATNVLRFSRAIAPVDNDGANQVVFYDWGVGADRKKMSGGISGAGIDKNIMDCYRFIVHNFEPGDQLFFFGFSRGAYTVRSLGGFIRNCGIFKREHADRIPSAYDHYRRRQPSSSPDAHASVELRRRYAWKDRPEIEFLGVWDTVGSLGVPVTFFGLLDNEEYLFHDTSPSSIIQCARHAMSIDECRKDFPVTRWDVKPGIDLKEVWFAGVHSDVGGGYEDDNRLSEVAATWMAQEAAARGLRFESFLLDALEDVPGASQHPQPTGIYRVRGKRWRKLLLDDLVHESVRRRYQYLGRRWKSPAFRKFFKAHDHDWSSLHIEGNP
ncbi:DUF2235 domain-containing protein [Haloferula rosea]|uniref:DUF2235 domain-containing protein n=1 Tax=Haloferula rosea TaxID=490093 RepID=A0A934RHN9_9BACT|nr:DUF2235 domain-containing protein [Haloferula rosea]MBK1828711.1 DUF2235 domain-containing protein [Haloferula rosea]